MKVRGIVLVDYIVDGFEDASNEQKKLKAHLSEFLDGNPKKVDWQIDFRERRGKGMPDIAKIKVRM